VCTLPVPAESPQLLSLPREYRVLLYGAIGVTMDMVYVKTATFVHCMVSGNKHCSLSLQQYEYTAAVNALSRELLDTWLQYAVVKALHEVNAVE